MSNIDYDDEYFQSDSTDDKYVTAEVYLQGLRMEIEAAQARQNQQSDVFLKAAKIEAQAKVDAARIAGAVEIVKLLAENTRLTDPSSIKMSVKEAMQMLAVPKSKDQCIEQIRAMFPDYRFNDPRTSIDIDNSVGTHLQALLEDNGILILWNEVLDLLAENFSE